MNRRTRTVIVLIAAAMLWVGGFAIAGYFFGLKGVGHGWPAALGVGGIAAAMLGLLVVVGGFVLLAEWFIEGGDR